MVLSYKVAGVARILATHLDAGARLAEAAASATLQGSASLPVVSVLTAMGAYATEVAIGAETMGQIASVYASFER